MRLLKISDVSSIVGGPETFTNNSKIASAINSATAYIEEALNTSFLAKTSVTDLFFLDPTLPYHRSGTVSLGLSNSFLASTPTPVVTSYDDYSFFSDGNGTAVTEDLRIDYENGKVTFFNKDFVKNFVSVTYDSGFTFIADGTYNDTEINSAGYDSLPDWLKQAVLQTSLHLYDLATIEDEKLKNKVEKGIPKSARILLANHLRDHANSYKPI